MSFKRRGDKWVAVAYDPATRKKVWVGTFDKRAEAKDAFEAAARDLKRAKGRRTETVESFAARWTTDYPRRKESTTLHYEQQIKAVRREFGHLLLTEVHRVDARRWALRNPSWRAARAMFSDARRDGLCDANPFADLRLPESRGRRDMVVPTVDELEALIAAAGRVHGEWGRVVYGPLLRFAAYSGLRLGELSGLGWQHIDLVGNTVLVERQWSPQLRKMTLPKNGLSRTMYLTPPARGALEGLPKADSDVVFSTPRGARFGGAVSHYYFHPVRCAVDRPDLDFHGLRHFFGTHLANLGLRAQDIALAMGHTDGGKLALSRYIHVTEADARARIAAAFGSGRPQLSVVTGANGAQDRAGEGS